MRNSVLGFGALVRRLTAAETRGWVRPYLTDPGVRRDVAAFARAWTGTELSDAARWLSRFERPVLLCWASRDWFFPIALAQRLLATFATRPWWRWPTPRRSSPLTSRPG